MSRLSAKLQKIQFTSQIHNSQFTIHFSDSQFTIHHRRLRDSTDTITTLIHHVWALIGVLRVLDLILVVIPTSHGSTCRIPHLTVDSQLDRLPCYLVDRFCISVCRIRPTHQPTHTPGNRPFGINSDSPPLVSCQRQPLRHPFSLST